MFIYRKFKDLKKKRIRQLDLIRGSWTLMEIPAYTGMTFITIMR